MAKICFSKVLLFVCISLAIVSCEVFEAQLSDDVDFFINHEPESNVAIIFYDEVQEVASKDITNKVDKIIGVFIAQGEDRRTDEPWVDTLNDSVNLMRVDAFKAENAEIVKIFQVKATPYLVLFRDGQTFSEEVVNDKTFDKVKQFLLQKKETNRDTWGNDNVPPTQAQATASVTQTVSSKPAAQNTTQPQPVTQPRAPVVQPVAQPATQPVAQPKVQPYQPPQRGKFLNQICVCLNLNVNFS